MPNLYGVANAPNILAASNGLLGGANITLVSGPETNIADSGALIAPSQGWFYPIVMATVPWQAVTAAPLGFIYAARIGAGADFDGFNYNLTGVTAGPVYTWTVILIGPASSVPWQGAGSHIYTTAILNSAGTVTLFNQGSHFVAGLLRAPDQ